MTNIETLAVRQPIPASANEGLSRELCQTVKAINFEYQLIDWEDLKLLNHFLVNALSSFEARGGNICRL